MSIWHTQKAFENNGLYVCRKMWFDGGTGAGEWVVGTSLHVPFAYTNE
jgi:hypothetical protein